jgi:transposase
MIVIGVDVHKHSLTAVAVDEAGRMLGERTVVAANGELLAWASALGEERPWALEDCRQLTRTLERELSATGEQLVRVPPKLMAPERSRRQAARQVGPDRRAGRRQSRPAGAAAEPPAPGRAAVSGAEAPRRSPRRPGR